jgi:acetyltransferase-like isoleucine patch superfamily enzyme
MKNPFIDSERNKSLRSYVLSQFISNVMTDEERAQLWGLPDGCRMRENAKILSPENLKCGEYVWIGEGAVLDASGGLEIGSHTSIGLSVMIWSHTSFLANLTMNNKIGSELIARAKTTIGSGCFIAGPSVIYHGVTIGDKTVVMPMSVVNEDTEGNCIVGGSPAKVIKKIDENFIEEQIRKFKEAGQLPNNVL